MTYNKLLTAGRTMAPAQITDSIKGLAADPRFAALLVLLENNRTGFSVAGSQQSLADRHGCLAHNAGSVHAITVIEGQLRNAIDPAPRRSGMQKPEGDSD